MAEGSVVKGIELIPVRTLKEAVVYLQTGKSPAQERNSPLKGNYDTAGKESPQEQLDFLEIKGQESAKRATMIAAAGMHNILYVGPPGSGKTMLAKRISSIMPELSFEEQLELTKIYSIAGQLNPNHPLMTKRPFRAPGHGVTQAALLGGGRVPRPGEVTLSGKGVLFLDELTEYRQTVLEGLRELFGGGRGTIELVEGEDILEAGIVIISQPPGKKLQNMMQLSGGEKALTAISLLFAIQNLKPSPFCLLDEIEAALDDSNVGRYANYLHKLTKHTQFIVITHRRGTMAAADRLYGITMQEKGVSALVSVDLIADDLEKEKPAS
jgi:energy-coupling factor transporter ATP-binding protein EcfA2